MFSIAEVFFLGFVNDVQLVSRETIRFVRPSGRSRVGASWNNG